MFDSRRETRRWALLTTFALSLGAVASAQGHYDEEEWWDVTEWFDGNDYEYQEFDGDDWDYDVDQDWNDLYGYGYDTRYDDDDWFYDYYDGVYSTYTDYGDGVYGYSTRYYDFDDDGFYDAYYTYNDWDGDGFYEDVDYHAIDDTRQSGNASRSAQRSADESEGSRRSAQRASDESQDARSSAERQRERTASTRFAFDGEIVKKKKASVRDTKHLVVELETRSGETMLADLGPVSELDDFDLMTGDRIRVRGPKTKVGEHELLIAKELAPNGGSLRSIERQSRCVKGHVADTRKATLDGEQRLLAIVRTDAWKKDSDHQESDDERMRGRSDKKWLVDLGPASELGMKLSQGQVVEVRGIPCKKDDRRILVATSFTRGDDEIEIDRRPAKRPMSPSRSSTSEAGYESSSGSDADSKRDTR